MTGTNPPPKNAANLSTKGWELSLAYRNNFTIASKPFNINAKLIVSDSRTKITRYDRNSLMLLNDYRVGHIPARYEVLKTMTYCF
ncbi:MAG TPA: hypothetical protein VJU78_11530 [Chitinophagaceae bacterium]|nr:hypothetical protein [Chitinophagaceae bacterium]